MSEPRIDPPRTPQPAAPNRAPASQRILDQAVLLAFGVLLSVAVFALRLIRPSRKTGAAGE